MQCCAENERCRKRGKHLILECDRKAQAKNRDKGTADKAISIHNIPLCSWRVNADPKSTVRNKTFLRYGVVVGGCLTARPPPPCPGRLGWHVVAMATLHQKTHHLHSVKQAARPLQCCEMSRMLFETNFLYLCSVPETCEGRRGKSGCYSVAQH